MCTPKLSYCKSTNSFQWVVFGLCFYVADRPECNVQLNLLGHGGATSKRLGHVAKYKSTTLPSCDLCYKSRVRRCQSGQPLCQCNTCTGQDIYDHPKASKYCELLHRYPTTQNLHCAIKEHYLVPHQSSFSGCHMVCS